MAKRKRPLDQDAIPLQKRKRVSEATGLAQLSDEIVLKILTNLGISDLAAMQRTSRRLQRLASDSQLWKGKYFDRWVRPRVMRLPGLKEKYLPPEALLYSSKLSKWLEHGHLIQGDKQTDWKRQYRLRYNWCRGSCKVQEVEVAEPTVPRVLAKVHQGVVFTLDALQGLRVWEPRPFPRLLASKPLQLVTDSILPSSLGLDETSDRSDRLLVSIGFEDGSFHLYSYAACCICFLYSHPPSSNGAVSATAIAFPYILNMSHEKVLSLYRFPLFNLDTDNGNLKAPLLLASLKSDLVYSPLSLSIRIISSGIVACVAYAFSRLNAGWTIGLQELRLTREGESAETRLASNGDNSISGFKALKEQHGSVVARPTSSKPFARHSHLMARPTSLSYAHPYLLATLPDNTLMVYLIFSGKELRISSGRRLWGHTSGVAWAEVSNRGKAVSVSTRGDDIRVWELEEVMTSSSERKPSVRLFPQKQGLSCVAGAIARRGDGLGLAVAEMQLERSTTRRWVGFDDEQIVVLGEQTTQRQILSCYDFT